MKTFPVLGNPGWAFGARVAAHTEPRRPAAVRAGLVLDAAAPGGFAMSNGFQAELSR